MEVGCLDVEGIERVGFLVGRGQIECVMAVYSMALIVFGKWGGLNGVVRVHDMGCVSLYNLDWVYLDALPTCPRSRHE